MPTVFYLILALLAFMPLHAGDAGPATGAGRSAARAGHPVFLPLVVDERTHFADDAITLTLDNGRLRVVVDKRWGGAIREIWY